jgi:5'-nucleotidase
MILVTNDDGIYSKGIKILYEAAVEVYGKSEVNVVAPTGPRSASGMSLTFHKPLRADRVVMPGIDGYAVSGTPADCVYIAHYKLFKGKRIDLILSGINKGTNAGMEAIESSGTVSAVKFGAVCRIKGIAFSLELDEHARPKMFTNTKAQIIKLLTAIKRDGMPKSADMLNVNIPNSVNGKTKVRLCTIEGSLFSKFVVRKSDPRGDSYYWLWSYRKKKLNRGSDCYAIFIERAISVTPLSLSAPAEKQMDEVRKVLKAY